MKVRLSSHNNFGDKTFTGISPHMKKLPASAPHPNLQYGWSNSETGENMRLGNIQEKSNFKDINRPTESVSFSGSAGLNTDESGKRPEEKKKNSFAKNAALFLGLTAAIASAGALIHSIKKGNVYERMAGNEKFHKILNFSEKNEVKIKALLSLGLAGMLKPICVIAMPGADEDDKKFTATKNALSAFLGYLLSNVICDPISDGLNAFMDNPEKYINQLGSEAKRAKGQSLIQQFKQDSEEAFKLQSRKERWAFGTTKINQRVALKTTYKNAPGLIVAPLKAALTIMIMPLALKFLFGDKKSKELPKEQPPLYMEPLLNPMYMNNIGQNKTFDVFTKGAKTAPVRQMQPSNITPISDIKAQNAERQGGAA